MTTATIVGDETSIIDQLLDRLPSRTHWSVEFGAWDGSVSSNTAHLVDAGDHAVLIEGNKTKFASLQTRHAQNDRVIPIHTMVGWDGANTLDRLLAQTSIPREFDVLSIDIDGNDYHVWEATTEYRPAIVVIEFNPTIPNGVEFVQRPDQRVNQGASVSSLAALAATKGYELVAATECNAFFARADVFAQFEIGDNSVSNIRTDTSWQTTVFFGFDGRAMFRGGRGLAWHGAAPPAEMRMVPRPLTGYPGSFGRGRLWLLRVWRAYRRRLKERDRG